VFLFCFFKQILVCDQFKYSILNELPITPHTHNTALVLSSVLYFCSFNLFVCGVSLMRKEGPVLLIKNPEIK
jgi:hypothetical protein